MAGFTLFEMLVALALLSLLTILLSGQIRFGIRAWEAGAAVADDLAELQTVQSFLRRQLAQAQPLRSDEDGVGGNRRKPLTFAGGPSALELAVAGVPRLGPAPYNIIELSHDRRSGIGRLHLVWRQHYPVTKASEEAEERRRVLLSGVRNVRFRYFGKIGEDEGAEAPRWYDRWNNQSRLPLLIRIELDFDDNGRYWPELTVALPTVR